jgi:hypothetical protein
MISSDQLAAITIRRVIFHDVPRKTNAQEPTLSEVETGIDTVRKDLLREKSVRVLGSKRAYPIRFDTNSASPIPDQVKLLTQTYQPSSKFVETSQTIAKYLFEQHTGAVSSGLLCVIDVAVEGSKDAIIVMKLEREEGAQLELTDCGGKKTFAMSVLDNLVLTDSTRLFKSAIFIRTGDGDGDFEFAACDGQVPVMASSDIAKFWMRFLGCTFIENPRITTQKFYESSMRFINTAVTDPVIKSDIYDHLQSQLKSAEQTFSPKSFLEKYIPHDYQRLFQEHLKDEKISLSTFTKDTVDIKSALKRHLYRTSKGAMISVPEAEAELVVVACDKITVNDSLASMK